MTSLGWLLAAPFLVVIGLALPYLAWSSFKQSSSAPLAQEHLPTMSALAIQAIVVHGIVFGLGWLALIGAGIRVPWLSHAGMAGVLAALGVVALGMIVAWMDSRRPTDDSNVVGRILERASPLNPMLLAMILSAGIAEEFAYRGVLTGLLNQLVGEGAAWAISAILFAFGHFVQGWRGFFGSLAFALALQGVVHLSGGLSLAIAAHIAYDLGAIWLSQRLAAKRP